ncbi:hypothetical protein E2C01_046264 [Portunus trituberculatus]|uniref:Uncharacterized protein n=1 Tax=Portunus trituberculatus TaxID=210409 RepID=A0A5B7G3X5_PORTR|nr:hypothetical protein [Portunus trituberculatus]
MLKEDGQEQRGARVSPLGDFTKAPGNTSFSGSFPSSGRQGRGTGTRVYANTLEKPEKLVSLQQEPFENSKGAVRRGSVLEDGAI